MTMSKYKLTFSLASLVLIFALAFAAMPAMAHDGHDTDPGHPAITISEASYPSDAKKSRANYRVKVVATVNGSSDSTRFDTAANDLSEVLVRPFTGDGAPLSNVTPTITKTTDKHEWLLVIDLAAVATARSIEVTIPANTVNGNRQGALGGNEAKSMSFTNLSPVLTYSAKLEAAAKKGAGGAVIPGRYTVTLTFLKAGKALVTGDADVAPEPTTSDIVAMPMAGAMAVDAAGAAVADGTTLTGEC